MDAFSIEIAEAIKWNDIVKIERLLSSGELSAEHVLKFNDNYELPVLIYAAQEQKIGIVKLLIGYGANVNRKNNEGTTALMVSVGSMTRTLMDILIDAGACFDMQNHNGVTALTIATRLNCCPRDVKTLQERSAQILMKRSTLCSVLIDFNMVCELANICGQYVYMTQIELSQAELK